MTDPTDPNATARYDTPTTAPAPEVPAAPASGVTEADPVPPPPAAPPVAPTPPSWGAQPTPSSWAAPATPPPTAWRPPTSEPGRYGSIVVGLIVLAVGLWFLADVTLGLELPRLRWNELWPVALVLVGAWIALGSMRRGSR